MKMIGVLFKKHKIIERKLDSRKIIKMLLMKWLKNKKILMKNLKLVKKSNNKQKIKFTRKILLKIHLVCMIKNKKKKKKKNFQLNNFLNLMYYRNSNLTILMNKSRKLISLKDYKSDIKSILLLLFSIFRFFY